jgi:hypothetical protein
MPYTPITLPENVQTDRFDTETNPRTPWGVGVTTGFIDAIQHGVTGTASFGLEKWYAGKYEKENWLDGKQAKEFYPNVSYPDGGYESVIKLVSDRKSQKDFNRNLLNNMDKNAFGYIGRTGAFVTGMMFDGAAVALSIAVGGGAEIAGGAAVGALATAPEIIQSVVNIGIGATEGALQIAPYVAADIYEGKQIQEPVSGVSALLNLSLGAFAGGLYRTFKGYKPIYSHKTAEILARTAVNQTLVDKEVVLEPILKQGIFEQQQGISKVMTTEAYPYDIERAHPDIFGKTEIGKTTYTAGEREFKPGVVQPGNESIYETLGRPNELAKSSMQADLDTLEAGIKDETGNIQQIFEKSKEPELTKMAFESDSLNAFKEKLEPVAEVTGYKIDGKKYFEPQLKKIFNVVKEIKPIEEEIGALESKVSVFANNLKNLRSEIPKDFKPLLERYKKLTRVRKKYKTFADFKKQILENVIIKKIQKKGKFKSFYKIQRELLEKKEVDTFLSKVENEFERLKKIGASEKGVFEKKSILQKKNKLLGESPNVVKKISQSDTFESFLKKVTKDEKLKGYKLGEKNFTEEEIGSTFEKSRGLDNYLNRMKTVKTEIDNVLKGTEAYDELVLSHQEPITPKEIQDSLDHFNDWKSNKTTYIEDFNNVKDFMEKDLPQMELGELEKDLSARETAGELDKAETESLDSMRSEEKELNNLSSVLIEKTIKCLTGE